jgi:hypothetical protein
MTLAQSKQASPETCGLTLADIEQVFGKGFSEEKPSKMGEIFSCRFHQKEYTIHISTSPTYGVKSIAEYNKMMSPKTVTWKPVPNDLDGAVIEIRDDATDDLASTPAISYIRNNRHVRIQVLGNYYAYDKSKMPAMREEMRTKLSKLKHIP